MRKSLETLMQDARAYLVSQRYAENSILQYEIKWRKFERYCQTKGIKCPDRETGERFVREYELENPPKKSHRLMLASSVQLLFDAQIGVGLRRMNTERYLLPDQFVSEMNLYKESLETKHFAAATIRGRIYQAKRFLSWLGDMKVPDAASITPEHVYDYITSIAWMRPQSITDTKFILRGFLTFLCEHCGASSSIGSLFPVIRVDKNSFLPSTYTPKEISSLLDGLDEPGRCALRDKAIVLLAIQHGLRAGDILGLKYDDIDWSCMRIALVQRKTGKQLTLPLQEESALAIIDYLKNERPDIEDSHIFFTHCAPFRPLVATSASHHMQASRVFERCGVDTRGKHHGLHSIRHSLAVNMLDSKTPLPVLSEVLGHNSTEASKVYLRVDVERLRSLSLEVPHG